MTAGDIRAEEDRARKQPVTMLRGELEVRDAYERGIGYQSASIDAAAYLRSWMGDVDHGPFAELLDEIASNLESLEHQK